MIDNPTRLATGTSPTQSWLNNKFMDQQMDTLRYLDPLNHTERNTVTYPYNPPNPISEWYERLTAKARKEAFEYYSNDVAVTEAAFNQRPSVPFGTDYTAFYKGGSYMTFMTYKIKEVKFAPPATIVFWTDGTKTVVKCGPDDTFDKEKGLAMAFIKKIYGNKGNYNNLFREWCKDEGGAEK